MAANDPNPKQRQLDDCRVDGSSGYLTTQQGVRVDHTDDALTVGERGPTLLEDFHAREKITHFDHERIPERVVHARGAGAYGYFEPYDDWLADYTVAQFLTTPGKQTPVFVRFSTVAGSRGSADTVRDVRGFATKFYTDQGNYDLVGNNFPVFFIQDGIKFPDFVHAVKPEPHNEIPQAQSAHDTLWDFVSLQPETLHTIMFRRAGPATTRTAWVAAVRRWLTTTYSATTPRRSTVTRSASGPKASRITTARPGCSGRACLPSRPNTLSPRTPSSSARWRNRRFVRA
ncbi:Catalase HPII [Mycobacterium innocens]|uniref:catalase n=1 Tax=Mycobacterium innocens TaxID=2341083 RepID=A0A498PNV4_9MYCO|nr:Catalase HPII [Mycobacterium innocens]